MMAKEEEAKKKALEEDGLRYCFDADQPPTVTFTSNSTHSVGWFLTIVLPSNWIARVMINT
jgi:hypothetical protein